MKDDLSSPSNATKYSYKVYEDGPLTYYHYYFEEIEPPLSSVESNQAATYPQLLPAGLSAAGLLTVAFASGFGVMSLVNSHQPAPSAPQPISKSPLKSAPSQKLSARPAVAPEKLTIKPASLRPLAHAKPVPKSTQVSFKPSLP